jgi:hypothetical protein
LLLYSNKIGSAVAQNFCGLIITKVKIMNDTKQQNNKNASEPDQNINSSKNAEQQSNKNMEEGQNSNRDDKQNPVYTNSDAPQQQIERDSQGVMAKGTKEDTSAIYNADNSTLQSKEEKQHDEKIDPQKNDDIEADKMSHTKADDRFLRRGENLNEE